MNLDPCTSSYTFHDLTEVADQEAGTYCIPSRSDQAAIDSIQQPNYVFQMTVADEHGINATGLSNALKQLRKDPKTDAELFFVVPPDQYPRCAWICAPTVELHRVGQQCTINLHRGHSCVPNERKQIIVCVALLGSGGERSRSTPGGVI